MTRETEIKKLWLYKKVDSKTILNLRAIKKDSYAINTILKAKDFDDIEDLKLAFEAEAFRLNDLGYIVYYVMNAIDENFVGKAASDRDIVFRQMLLIDIDKVGHVGECSNEYELNAAIHLGNSIASELESEGFGKPYRLMSGNGMHLYILLDDIVNNESNKALIENVLKLLSEKFNNDIVHVDTCVFNAARITKVPGTIASKGPNTADRPHRMAVVL